MRRMRRQCGRYTFARRGGVITIVFSLSAAFMRGKITTERSRAFPAASRRVLRSVFPEIAFLFVCVIVLPYRGIRLVDESPYEHTIIAH